VRTAVIGGGKCAKTFLAGGVEEVKSIRGAVDRESFELLRVKLPFANHLREMWQEVYLEIYSYCCGRTLIIEMPIAIPYKH
jgi:hypothetical protein